MSQNDEAVLTAAVGYVYVHDTVGAAAPTPAALKSIDLDNPASWAASGWRSVGHTSRNELPEFGFEGGGTEMRGSWQKKKLREITTEDPIDFLTVFLHEFDENALSLYYGENTSAAPGVFGVKTTNDPNEKAFLVVIEDGDFRLGHRVPKANVRRDDSIQLPIDDLAALPIRATYLEHGTEDLFQWLNEDLFNAVAALPRLKLGGATGGTFTLKVDGRETGAITVSGISTTTIRTALAAVDDGIPSSAITVTAAGSDWDIDIPALLELGTIATATGGTGITLV
jgi:hypothetical protein